MKLKEIKFMYGTHASNENTPKNVINAVNFGFNAIDTAEGYGYYKTDEDEYISAEVLVGQALRALSNQSQKRDDIWIQTKYNFHWKRENLDGNVTAINEDIEYKLSISQQRLGVSIDSYLLHAPFEKSTLGKLSQNDVLAWKKFEKFYLEGKVKAIGVSNFNFEQLQELTKIAEIKPMILQNFYGIGKLSVGDWDSPYQVSEYNKLHNQEQEKILDFCKKNNIQFQSFNNKIAEDMFNIVNDLSQKYNISQKQVVYSFEHQLGIVPITSTANHHHLQENIASFEVKFTNLEMQALGAIPNIALVDEL